MKKMPLLTIAIPTYNRAGYLALCLERIGEEIDSLDDEPHSQVKIYVSDNASSDETPGVIAEYKEKRPDNFEAVRNASNLGPDVNIAQCYDSVSTPYVWIVGDDDVILPGSLQKILDYLASTKVDILYVNNYWFDQSHMETPRKKEKHGVTSYRSATEFARRTNVMLTFISGQIVRSCIGRGYRNELVASNLVQLSWVLPLLRDGKHFGVLEDWIVAAKGSNSGGYGLVKVFGNNLVKITGEILKNEPDVAKAIQNGVIVNFFSNFILEFRKGSSKFTDQDIECGLKEAFGGNWRYYLFLLPLIRLPLFAAAYYNVFLKVVRRLFRSVLV